MKYFRDKIASIGPKCRCHLCQKIVFDIYDPDGNCDFYNMNGTLICAHDLEVCRAPTIFCRFLDMWKSQWYPCCCTSHKDSKDCELNGATLCLCPRCCRQCMKKFWPPEAQDPIKCCFADCQCHLKSRLYVPCKHLRGYCF